MNSRAVTDKRIDNYNFFGGNMTFAQRHKKFIDRTLSVLIPFSSIRKQVRYIVYHSCGTWQGVCIAWRIMRDGKRFERICKQKYVPQLSVVAIMKNEAAYVREWIEYHKLIGVEKFFLYDNGSTDNTKEILEPYIKSGIVEYVFFPGVQKQRAAYDDCITHHRMDTVWLAVIDLDEFIVPVKFNNALELLKTIPASVAEAHIDWAIFGSSGHETKPDGLVLENYVWRAKQSWFCKSIVNPRRVLEMLCHKHNVLGRVVDVPLECAQVNHYHCKSWQEYQLRQSRGDAYFGADAAVLKYTRKTFDDHNKNEVQDVVAHKYLSQLKHALS